MPSVKPAQLLLAAAVSALAPHAATQELYDIDTIRTIEITAPTNWRTTMANNYASKTLIKVDVKIDGKTYKDVGARHRGFSSYRFLPRGKEDKRPWKLLFDEYIDGQDVQGYRTLNLNNNIWDPSFVREVATFELMRRYVPAPKSCYIRVVVNNEDLGLFTNTQQINKDFLQEHFRDDEGIRYRGDRASLQTSYDDTALTWLGQNQPRYQAAYELKTENGSHAPWVRLMSLTDTLNNTPDAQLASEVPKELDIDNALRFIAVANATAWLDSYLGRTCKNFYIYEDPFHGRISLQPWDVNNAFGGLTDGLGSSGIARLSPMYRENDTRYPRPLFSQLVKVPAWRARYLAHMRTILPDLDWANMGKRLEELRTLIRPALQADAKRIYTMQQFDANVTQSVFVGFVTAPALKPFFEARHQYLSTESNMARVAPTLAELAHTPVAPRPSDPVTVTARVSGVRAVDVTLHYRARGAFRTLAMFDDGQHGDGAASDGVYGARIPAHSALQTVEYFVTANSDLASSSGAMSVAPPTGSYGAPSYRVLGVRASGPIVISEVLAKNDTFGKDEADEFDDWIELTNVSTQAVPVSGMYLTDNAGSPTKWQIPAGYTLQPGASLLIWADDTPSQGPLHAKFKLSASGEEIALFASDGTTNLDWFEFGEQLADRSTGRVPGTLDEIFSFVVPTPGAPNEAVPCGHSRFVSADSSAVAFELVGSGMPKVGQSFDLRANGAPANGACLVLLGSPAATAISGLGTLLLAPATLLPVAAMASDGNGAGSLSVGVPSNPALAGLRVHFQALGTDGVQLGLSTGVATRICP